MTALQSYGSSIDSTLPSLIIAAGDRAEIRFVELFAANIRDPHTRRAYGCAVADFLDLCADAGVPSICAVQPLHVASWLERQANFSFLFCSN